MKSKTRKYQFQVGYILNPGLNINKAFIEKVDSNIALTFNYKTIFPIRKVLRKDNTRVISLLKQREHYIQRIDFSFLLYNKNYVCDDHICFPQTKLHVANK